MSNRFNGGAYFILTMFPSRLHHSRVPNRLYACVWEDWRSSLSITQSIILIGSLTSISHSCIATKQLQ